jgi:hypothetical protein
VKEDPPTAVEVPTEAARQAEWRAFTRNLREVFRIHRSMMRKLLSDDRMPPPELSVALESFANRYLDFADQISERWARQRSEIEESAEPGVGGPSVAA